MEDLLIIRNPVLWIALGIWALAQILKPFIHYMRTRHWDWALLLRAGGMPSSHSALVASTAHGIGLFHGFETPLFAVAVTLAVIVIYDATGVRRQAGVHAERINEIIKSLASGHPRWRETQEQLKEVLGHTPMEAMAGTVIGVVFTHIIWYFFY